MKVRYILLSAAVATLPGLVAASDRFSIGYSPALQSFSVNDDIGDSGNESDFSLIGFTFDIPFSRDGRNRSGITYVDEMKFAASNNDVGQEMSGFGLDVQYQHKFPLTRNFKPWLGGGLSLNKYEFSKRHKVDSGGFLTQTFTDRDEVDIGAVLSVATDFEFGKNSRFGLEMDYLIPFGQGVKGFQVKGIYFPGFLN